jgi:FkbH-like protein
MIEYNYSDLLLRNSELAKLLIDKEKYKIALLSNIIVSQAKEIVEYNLRIENINADVTLGNYDNIVQDSIKYNSYNAILIFWEISNLINGFHFRSNLLSDIELHDIIQMTKNDIDIVISNLQKAPLVIFNKFSSLLFNSQFLRVNKLDLVCNELNHYLESKISSNIILIDIDKIISNVSFEKSINLRFFYSSKMLYSIDFFVEYSSYITPIFRSINGKSKKALIFDCDNTLWKGIVGEDGFDGIQMSANDKEGIIFQEVQSIAVELAKKGIIIGLCSKNNPDDVNEVLINHKDMILRDGYLAIKKINWNDKVTNIKEIQRELNIAMESIVFVDDSEFEINLIKENIPEINIIQVPKKLFDYPKIIRENVDLFYNISQTDEDLKKINLYKEQAKRKEAESSFSNLEDYHRSLELKLIIYEDDKTIIPRMAQLTQKTNQFNLTTKRYSETDITDFIESNNSKIYAFKALDKFGDNGITGLVILKFSDKEANIDTFLLSCRIIGRNLEYAFFDYLVNKLKERNVEILNANYIKTLKNEQVSLFYENLNFKFVESSELEKKYSLQISDYVNKNINYVEIVNV